MSQDLIFSLNHTFSLQIVANVPSCSFEVYLKTKIPYRYRIVLEDSFKSFFYPLQSLIITAMKTIKSMMDGNIKIWTLNDTVPVCGSIFWVKNERYRLYTYSMFYFFYFFYTYINTVYVLIGPVPYHHHLQLRERDLDTRSTSSC